MADLPNLPELEAEWAIFMENRSGPRGQWTQDQRWRADNPVELQALVTYREGGARPTLVTEPGRRMVAHLDAWHKAKGEEEPPPPPPPTGKLASKPPGWNGVGDVRQPSSFPGYQVKEIRNSDWPSGSPLELNLTNGVDYYLKFVEPIRRVIAPTEPNKYYSIHINGGRNVVSFGADVEVVTAGPVPRYEMGDTIGFLIDGGTDGGTVYFEGPKIRACNPITMRSRRNLVVQWFRLIGEDVGGSNGGERAHSDPVQIWGTDRTMVPCESIKMHYGSIFTDFTGLSVLTQVYPTSKTDYINPKTWWRHKIDMHPIMKNGLGQCANYAYLTDSHVGGNGPRWQDFGPYTVYDSEIWVELPQGGGGAYIRGLDDIANTRSFQNAPTPPGVWAFPYEIYNKDGVLQFTSADPPPGGSHPTGRVIGNYMTYNRVTPFKNMRWIAGQPPAAESVVEGTGVQGQQRRVFVPAGSVGMSYQPVDYA